MKKNILESLPGFWPVTRKKILNKYWNVDKLAEISINEISEILNKNQIQTLQDHGLFPD
jgi:excinuclease UvrABC nuclease subunit